MGVWIDFAELRSKVSLEQIIFEMYQVTGLMREGDKLIGPCPVHGGDNPRAFHADLSSNIWKCHTRCGRGGNQLDFAVRKENISIREAALKVHAFFIAGREVKSEDNASSAAEKELPTASKPEPASSGEKSKPTPAASKKTVAPKSGAAAMPAEPRRNPVITVKLVVSPRHPHLLEERKLNPETIAHFGVGYCAKGILRGCVAIPIHNAEGELVAYAGRRLKEEAIREHGKYVLPKGFRKELELYNFHRAKALMKKEGLIIVESFFTVMKLNEAGFENAVSVMGCELSDEQAELASKAPEVILLFDGDEAGWKGAETAREKLKGRTIVRLIRLPEGAKPDTLPAKAVRWAVNGARSLDLAEVNFSVREK